MPGRPPRRDSISRGLPAQDEVLGAFRLWEKVIQKVEAGEMPPEDAKPLTDAQRRTLVDWHRRTFVDVGAAPGPESAPPAHSHRVSEHALGPARHPAASGIRLESFYNVEAGSIVEKLLPADPPGPSGFDNDASVLTLGPAEFAKALQVADYLVDQLDSLPEARQALFAAGAQANRRRRPGASRGDPRPVRRPRVPAPGRGGRACPVPRRLRGRLLRPAGRAGQASDDGGATAVLEEPRFAKAVQEAFKAILVSPKFLYRLETVRGSHEPYRISDHELATRLSYFLWSTMPDDELFRAGRGGSIARARASSTARSSGCSPIPGASPWPRISAASGSATRSSTAPTGSRCRVPRRRPSCCARSIASRSCSSTTWCARTAACSI